MASNDTSFGVIPGKQSLQINTINSTITGNIEMFFVLALNQVIDGTRNLEGSLQKTLTSENSRLIIGLIYSSFTV